MTLGIVAVEEERIVLTDGRRLAITECHGWRIVGDHDEVAVDVGDGVAVATAAVRKNVAEFLRGAWAQHRATMHALGNRSTVDGVVVEVLLIATAPAPDWRERWRGSGIGAVAEALIAAVPPLWFHLHQGALPGHLLLAEVRGVDEAAPLAIAVVDTAGDDEGEASVVYAGARHRRLGDVDTLVEFVKDVAEERVGVVTGAGPETWVRVDKRGAIVSVIDAGVSGAMVIRFRRDDDELVELRTLHGTYDHRLRPDERARLRELQPAVDVDDGALVRGVWGLLKSLWRR